MFADDLTTPSLAGAEEHLAHFAMCERSETGAAPIVPPLGWVLPKPKRQQFPNIFKDCGNDAELKQIEAALD